MAIPDDVSPRSDESDTDARDQLDIRLPERCNLRLHVKGAGFCSVDVSSKLEGDVDIELDHGDIRVNKIRGPNVNFHTNRGVVHVKTVAEGALSVRATELEAKTLQGPTLLLDTEADINVRAAYAGEISASSRGGSVVMGTVHAPMLECDAPGGVRVDALKGDARLTSSEGDIKAHFDAQGPDGQSVVSAAKGDVNLSVQLYAAVDIDFSAREISFPPPSMGAVSFEGSQRLSQRSSTAKGRYLAGSRADSESTRSSGKISLEGRQAAASLAATRGSDGMHLPPADTHGVRATAAEGRVELRIGSWIENMRKKLKFDFRE